MSPNFMARQLASTPVPFARADNMCAVNRPR